MARSTPSSKTPVRAPISITSSLRSKVRPLCQHASWSFHHSAHMVGITVSTVYSICSTLVTPQKKRMGKQKLLTTPIRKRLVATATASQQHCCLLLLQMAEIANIVASSETLRDAIATEGYHRRVATVCLFLNSATTIACQDWAHHYAD